MFLIIIMIKWGLRILSKTPKKANNGFNEEVFNNDASPIVLLLPVVA